MNTQHLQYIIEIERTRSISQAAENLYLGQVLHRAFLAVGEKGTRAGAATSVAVGATSAMPVEEPKVVLLDRPFLYAIWDTEANLPVFLGTCLLYTSPSPRDRG